MLDGFKIKNISITTFLYPMTEPLYMKDSYLKKWDAKVISVKDDMWENFLEKSATK